MRKTQSYFSRKMTLIQKLFVMEWLKRYSDEECLESDGCAVKRSYYRYESLTEIAEHFRNGRIISGFTLPRRENHIFVSFGRQVEKVCVVGISLSDFNNSESHCGLVYGKLHLCTDDVPVPMPRIGLEKKMICFCILLPLRKKNVEFHNKFAIVYSDWDIHVCHPNGKQLPRICKDVFSRNLQ